jgi:hypothetical protein
MKLFKLIDLQYNNFLARVRNKLSSILTDYGQHYGTNSIFGQLISVLGSVVQNMFVYIEDALVEQNKYTAVRKRSIYNLAQLSGYNPSTGHASTATLKMNFLPNNEEPISIMIPNKTRVLCSQNGLTYNMLLAQECLTCNVAIDNSPKYITVVEGAFETQTFMSQGGQLYSINVIFVGDVDVDYLEVYVNNELWERKDSLYDMTVDGKEYVCKTSLSKGLDLFFGNDEHGRSLKYGDQVKVTYLIHSGESGNIDFSRECEVEFEDKLKNIAGDEIDGNNVFLLSIEDKESITGGTFSENTEQTRQMIGLNSRSLVLADAKNYKQLFQQFSFVGYNRVWSEPGSMIINALIMKNYKQNISQGKEYFNLQEQDFLLTENQKNSIYSYITNSGQQLAGTIFNIMEPTIRKYAMYVFIKCKEGTWDTADINNRVRNLVGSFFADEINDMFIPKSDIIHLLKSNINEIDGVNIYFLSEQNESALITRSYDTNTYTYNPATGTYSVKTTTSYIYGNENPNLGLDSHGNILLESHNDFPVLMGGWQTKSKNSSETIAVTDPLIIVYQ